jgi:hypothetical protein
MLNANNFMELENSIRMNANVKLDEAFIPVTFLSLISSVFQLFRWEIIRFAGNWISSVSCIVRQSFIILFSQPIADVTVVGRRLGMHTVWRIIIFRIIKHLFLNWYRFLLF